MPAWSMQNWAAVFGKARVWTSRLNRSSSAKAAIRPSSSRQAEVSWLKQLIPSTYKPGEPTKSLIVNRITIWPAW